MAPGLSLSLYWFFYLGSMGLFFPFWSRYLHNEAGLSMTQVGVIQAVLPLTGIVTQMFWGWIADRTGARRGVLVILTVGAAVGTAVMGLTHGFWPILGATLALGLFSTAVGPLTLSVHLGVLADRGPHAFGRVRVWGTVGYLVGVVGFARLVDGAAGWSLAAMFPATAALLMVAALVACTHPRGGAVALKARPGDASRLLSHAPVVRLCLWSFAATFFMHGPMVLFPKYVERLGGGVDLIGQMWIPMLLPEIVLVLVSGAWIRRLGARGMMAAAVALGGMRWLTCGLVPVLEPVLLVQLVHGLVVVGMLVGGPMYMESSIPASLRSTAQSLYSIFGSAIGASASAAFFGWLMEAHGTEAAYTAAGAGAALLGLLTFAFLPVPRRPESAPSEIASVIESK